MTSLLYIIQTTSLSKINKNILKNIEKQLKNLIHIAVATKMINFAARNVEIVYGEEE